MTVNANVKMKFVIVLSLLAVGLVTSLDVPEKDWWQTAVVYQIYPRSFKDSNGDGIGDLNGITEKLQYLKDTGVDVVWLSPIYLSPMYDFGYDITNYTAIQPEYGTMEDFDRLLAETKKLGMRLVLDFVPNHTSNESDWFVKSSKREKGYENYYVWADGRPDPKNPGKTLPPSNWISNFRKSAWEYSPTRGQYYLHQFVIGQPDLNFRDPGVVNEIKNVLRFWLDKGVHGFRVDTIPTLFEVDPIEFGGKYPDEPRTGRLDANPEDPEYLEHIYTKNQNPTYDMVCQWRDVLNEYTKRDGQHRIMLTEAYEDIHLVMRYYGNRTHDGSDLPFNFDFLKGITSSSSARDIKFTIDKWLTYMPYGKTANWVNGNHDNNRVASRNGIEKADGLNMIALLLPGVALTYQGEELALTDGEVSWEETVDPAACNTDDPINYVKRSRDPARTPFPWNNSTNAGFSNTTKNTWLPLAKNYKTVNFAAQKAANKSHYQFYTDLTRIRRTDQVRLGDLDLRAFTDDILAFTRTLPGHKAVVAVFNVASLEDTIDLSVFRNLPAELEVYSAGVDTNLKPGTIVGTESVNVPAHGTFVLQSRNVLPTQTN